jgi:hypothetical protein
MTTRTLAPIPSADRASHATTTPVGASRPRWVQRIGQVATAAPTGFFAVMTLLGLVTPGYDALSRFGSELSLGPLGPVMIANFVALGLTVLALAVALGRAVGDRISGWVVTGGIAITGAAFVVAGVCVTDPARLVSGSDTLHGMIHAFMAVVIFFLATPTAALAMAVRCREQRAFRRYCLLVAVGTPALLVGTFVSGGLIGLTERIVIAYVLVWLTVLAVRVRRGDLADD